jgi:hypothetical protein
VAELLLYAGAIMFAGCLTYLGIQGVRGVADSSGKRTSRSVAVIALTLAGAILVAAFVGIPLAMPRF